MTNGTANVPQGFDSFGPWLNEAFEHYKSNWQPWVLMSLVYVVIVGGAYGVMYGLAAAVGDLLGSVSGVVGWVVSLLLMPGLVRAGLKQVRGQGVEVGDIFSGTDMFGTVFVISLASAAGLIVCGIGALVTGTLFCLAIPFAVDRRASIGDSLTASYEATKRNFFFFLVYAVVIAIIGSIGSIACGIGVIFTFPIWILGLVVAYERVFNPGAAAAADPLGPIPPVDPIDPIDPTA